MNLSYYIARRYLFSKKSHNAINVISIISVCGVVVATMALVCILSIFNGFTGVVSKTFSAFDPDLRITPVMGKVFDASDSIFEEVRKLPEIDLISESLEENALLKFENRQEPINLRGVSSNFGQLSDIDKLILDGELMLRSGDIDFGIMGIGLASHMGTRAGFLSPLEIYMPKRNSRINVANPMSTITRAEAYVSGVFALNQAEYDEQLLIVSIELVRELLQYDNEVSSLDIKVKPGVSPDAARLKIRNIIGNDYRVKNRWEQQEDSYRWVNIEKWITFLILALISMIAIFNVVGSLSMLIIEKEDDIKILQSMGANNQLVSKIFLIEGWLITFCGSIIGLALGLIICFMQIHFGLLKIGDAGIFIIDAYPIVVEFSDIAIIFVTINVLGFLAVLYPVNHLRKKLNKQQSVH